MRGALASEVSHLWAHALGMPWACQQQSSAFRPCALWLSPVLWSNKAPPYAPPLVSCARTCHVFSPQSSSCLPLALPSSPPSPSAWVLSKELQLLSTCHFLLWPGKRPAPQVIVTRCLSQGASAEGKVHSHSDVLGTRATCSMPRKPYYILSCTLLLYRIPSGFSLEMP